MKLQTQIPLIKANNQIDYSSQLLLLGSCFSENIGAKLNYFKFQSIQNPFGILFHPLAIENLIYRAVEEKLYTETDVFFLNERWHCFDAHSEVSKLSKDELLITLNLGLTQTRQQLKKASHIIITLGTAWAYRHKETSKIVANCHKVPQKEFEKCILSIEEIATSLENTRKHILSINKNIQIICTISPVRHLKDGFVENQRSKAHLISALHGTFGSHSFGGGSGEAYFESYELMMDELRDYRFYTSDMVHPNDLAIEYIWEKFKHVWISEYEHQTMNKIEDIQKGLAHRPFYPESEQHQKFQKSLQAKIAYIKGEYPFMEFN